MESLPTLYEYYTADGVVEGLSTENPYFTLNKKNITLYSGSLHYFRVPSDYWRDRLRKFRAAGLNAVYTYVPWNLHEPRPGKFDFGIGGSEWEDFLDIRKFLKTAQEEDLFVLLRPGPYICAEWEFGGMPSFLLREKLELRTSDERFMKYVRIYFKELLSVIVDLQFTKGGPIIAFQVENEYGNTEVKGEPVDKHYLQLVKDTLLENGVAEMLFTSDTPSYGTSGSIPGVLYTANFQNNSEEELKILQSYQPGKPLLVSEYWTGWYDHWTEIHHTRTNEAFTSVLESILNFPASVNMYMFFGGTNFGFLNGGDLSNTSTNNIAYGPVTSSYDYDAPLTEAGNFTDKYFSVKELIQKHNKIKTKLPDLPKLNKAVKLPKVNITGQLTFPELPIKSVQKSNNVISMEKLDINEGNGQSYGYIDYKKCNIDIPANSILTIEGHVCDTVMVLINGKLVSKITEKQSDLDGFGYWRLENSSLNLGDVEYKDATLDLIVENFGRVNFGKLKQFHQYKGLWQGNVTLNNEAVLDWSISPLEFKPKSGMNLSWHEPEFTTGPSLYRGTFILTQLNDTYVDMRSWKKGIIIINGFVLSRYFRLGPQQTAFLPAPLLKLGENEIIIFEHFVPSATIEFSDVPIFETLP